MKLIQQIPNALTLGNLICGIIGIQLVFSTHGNIELGCLLLCGAAFFDLLDGMAARLLRVSSEIGKQLDSLADMVSFGVLPYTLLYESLNHEVETSMYFYLLLLIPVCTCIRLAKFNIDTRQSVDFIGMPSPAQGLCTAAVAYIISTNSEFLNPFLTNFWVVIAYTIVISFLMVSSLPLKSFKLQKGGIKAHIFHLIVIGSGIILFALYQVSGIFFTVIIYILLSLFIKNKNLKTQTN